MIMSCVRRGASGAGDGQVFDYRHPRARRKYIPPAGIESQRRIAERPAERYSHNPHLTPVLRFDPTGRADEYLALVQAARTR